MTIEGGKASKGSSEPGCPQRQLSGSKKQLGGPQRHTAPQIRKSSLEPSQVVTLIFGDLKVWFDYSYLQK